MKTTYVIQNNKNEVLGYFEKLEHAKYDFIKQFNYKTCFILMMRGCYFGEGYHQYKLNYINGKFKRTKLR